MKKSSKLEEEVADAICGIIGGLGLFHFLPRGIMDFYENAKKSYNPKTYIVTKVSTAALIGAGYYYLAEKGHLVYLAIPALTNSLSLFGEISKCKNNEKNNKCQKS